MRTSISKFNRIYNLLMDKYYQNKALAKQTIELTAKEEYYLDIIFRLNQPTLSAFATAAKISKPAATQIINKYVEKKYLDKVTSTTDKRISYIQLKSEIRQYFKNSYAELDQLYAESLAFLSKSEVKQLNSILRKIERHLS